MNNEPPASSCQLKQEQQNPVQVMATQFGLTREQTDLVISIVQQSDPSLTLLKQPKVQEIIKQRKGRWIQEEEDFANFLTDEFGLGLSSIENGMTKRAYLSSKLVCTKMRISKKFKGKNTGKEVFLRKERLPNGRELSPQELCYYEHRHVELEKRFLKGVLKSVINCGVKNAQRKKSSPLPPYPPPHVAQPSIHTMQQPSASFAGAGISTANGTIECTQKAGALMMPMSSQNMHGHGQLNPDKKIQLSGFTPSAGTQPNISPSTQMSAPNAKSALIVGMQHQQDARHTGTFNQPSAMTRSTLPCSNQTNPIPSMSTQITGANPIPAMNTQTNRENPIPAINAHTAAVSPHNQHFANQPNPMMAIRKMQAPCGTVIQVKTQGFDNTGLPSGLLRNTVQIQDRAVVLSSCQKAPVFFSDSRNISRANNYYYIKTQHHGGSSTSEGQKKRQITEPVDSGGYSFQPLQYAGGGKRFKPTPATTASHQRSHTVSTSASEPSSNDESDNVPSSNEASTTYLKRTSVSEDATSVVNFYDNDIPDLLSGFDKHVASMKKKSGTVPSTTTDVLENRPIPENSHFFAGAIGESPYITSKSFDELHRFLGKGLSSDMMPNLDLNQSQQPPAPKQTQIGELPSFLGEYVSQITVPVNNVMTQEPFFDAIHFFDRPPSTSNSSDLTASD